MATRRNGYTATWRIQDNPKEGKTTPPFDQSTILCPWHLPNPAGIPTRPELELELAWSWWVEEIKRKKKGKKRKKTRGSQRSSPGLSSALDRELLIRFNSSFTTENQNHQCIISPHSRSLPRFVSPFHGLIFSVTSHHMGPVSVLRMIQQAGDLQWVRKLVSNQKLQAHSQFLAGSYLDTQGPRPQTSRPADIELAGFRMLVAAFAYTILLLTFARLNLTVKNVISASHSVVFLIFPRLGLRLSAIVT